MSDSREQILNRVRAALAPLLQRAPLPEWERELVDLRGTRNSTDLWALFAERLKAVNGTPLTTVAELVALLESNGWRHGYCDPALWPRLREAFSTAFTVETDFDRRRIDDYQFGITAATGAIAETGTVILSDRDTSRRLGALAPWVHIATVRRDQIFADLTAAVAALPVDPNVIWVTGPSKTADVEGILIEGVHGPGRQITLLMAG
jgi:L-lactate dehydrogenase complex protein LldG